ncbi:hypothetical protein R5R35_009059 [Gryllus longicercus]|uniref:RING-type domain-containing protein n=1 Tax=Gryllus longicercus TaxID=2509291 RepID=A0AAN9Z5A5_9ORTH
MSWESIASREYLSGAASHQLSAAALLPSPDGSRHPLDVYDFAEEELGHRGPRPAPPGLWDCLVGCRRRVDQQLARRKVEQGLRLYSEHKQQSAVRKWRNALKRIRKVYHRPLMMRLRLRSQVEQGLRLYSQHKQQAAVRKWRSALKRIRKVYHRPLMMRLRLRWQVERGLRLYIQHKQQAAVRKWRSALKRICKVYHRPLMMRLRLRCQVEQGLRLYSQHKQQAVVRKWRSALKRIRKVYHRPLMMRLRLRWQVEQGLRLYSQHKQQAAVRKWRSALKRIRKREDKFTLLGYLYQAYMDWGKYRESLEFAHRQLSLAEEADSPNLRAEAYLSLARAHQRLGGLERALAYGRHSLYNECDQCQTAGQVHLTVGSVYLELAAFCKALEAFQQAHKIAQGIQDPALELQVYVGLSELFGRLQDADKSARYAAKAYDLSRSLQLGDLNSRHHRAALLQMASALRKQGELGDAQDYCTEATRLSIVSGDQAAYARSIRIMGDIYRKKSDINKAYRQYESAMGSAAGMGDRLCQMEAMDGAARCLEALRLQQKICNCRPLEFNTRLLEVASSVGAKLLVRTVRVRLGRIYESLGDTEQQALHERLAQCVEEELELQCGACALPFGLEADSLEALPCAHILHARCAHELLRSRSGRSQDKKKKRLCPDCHRSVSSRLYLQCEDPHRSTFSLASLSLRASDLTLSSRQATSSV